MIYTGSLHKYLFNLNSLKPSLSRKFAIPVVWLLLPLIDIVQRGGENCVAATRDRFEPLCCCSSPIFLLTLQTVFLLAPNQIIGETSGRSSNSASFYIIFFIFKVTSYSPYQHFIYKFISLVL